MCSLSKVVIVLAGHCNDVVMWLGGCGVGLVDIGMTYGTRVKGCLVSVFIRAEEAGSGILTKWW